ESHGEPKRAPLAHHALHADLAVHGREDLPADGETETRAAGPPGGELIDLGELLEEPALSLRRDAGARVHDVEAQLHSSVGLAHAHDLHAHAPVVRELDGVAEQVQQYLTEPARIPAQGDGHGGRNHRVEIEPLLLSARGKEYHDAPHQLRQVEVFFL